MKRKLTTILYADGVGFGARMEADEAATLDSLRRAREVMRALFDAHDGREVNTWGDAVIAEFASVVEAVRCAVAIQEALARAAEREDELRFRIGVNLGDVMIDGENLFGDGVNVAERLQSLARPGGVTVSGAVRDLAHKQLALGFDFAGEQRVKSLAEPVSSWAVRMGDNAPPPPPPPPGGASPERFAADADPQAGPADPAAAQERTARIVQWLQARLGRFLDWYGAQPKRVRGASGMVLFFFGLNAFTSGLSTPWFVFPSLPFLLYILMNAKRRPTT
ncbi:MAG: adenylate/guanylate cyclase domain-containing protein [Pseudomonadota bacterium]